MYVYVYMYIYIRDRRRERDAAPAATPYLTSLVFIYIHRRGRSQTWRQAKRARRSTSCNALAHVSCIYIIYKGEAGVRLGDRRRERDAAPAATP